MAQYPVSARTTGRAASPRCSRTWPGSIAMARRNSPRLWVRTSCTPVIRMGDQRQPGVRPRSDVDARPVARDSSRPSTFAAAVNLHVVESRSIPTRPVNTAVCRYSCSNTHPRAMMTPLPVTGSGPKQRATCPQWSTQQWAPPTAT